MFRLEQKQIGFVWVLKKCRIEKVGKKKMFCFEEVFHRLESDSAKAASPLQAVLFQMLCACACLIIFGKSRN